MGEGAFEGKQYVHQILYTELKTFVDTQQYLFDNLCSHSVPAKEKIREIGRGFNGEFHRLFRLPPKFKKSLQNLWIRQRMKYCYFFPRLIHFTEQNIAEC
jgi:hypothetical protein